MGLTGEKRIGDRVLGKRCFFCCFGIGIILALLIVGCGGGGDGVSPGNVQIVSGDALNPQASALARRRRIAGETLTILFDGDSRPSHQVPVAEVIDLFTTTAGNHLAEFALQNLRGQTFATGRQQVLVSLRGLQTVKLSFDLPVCGVMSDVICQTPAVVTPTNVFADVETEQCVSIAENLSPVSGLRICIPSGVLDADTTIAVTEVYNLPNGVPDHLSQSGVIVEIRFDPEPFFSQPITLQFPYDEELVATGPQNLGINEAELSLFQLNRQAGQWVPIPGQAPPNTNDDTIRVVPQ